MMEEINHVLEGGAIHYEALGMMTYLESWSEESTRKYPISPLGRLDQVSIGDQMNGMANVGSDEAKSRADR